MATLIMSAKLNDIDPQAWLAVFSSVSPTRRSPAGATTSMELDTVGR